MFELITIVIGVCFGIGLFVVMWFRVGGWVGGGDCLLWFGLGVTEFGDGH